MKTSFGKPPKRFKRRRRSSQQRLKLLDGTFGFLLHVGASPVSAFARTSTPHPRFRPKPGYHRSGFVAGGNELALAYMEQSSNRYDIGGLSFDELWRAAAPESVRFSPR